MDTTINIDVRDRTVELAHTCLNIYRMAENRWVMDVKANPDIVVDCQKGCAKCCYQIAIGSLVSGVLIADWLIKNDALVLRQLITQGSEQGQLMMSDPQASHTWLRNEIPCVLLESGFCRVYRLRPPACSSYLVAGGRETCDAANPETRVASADNTKLMHFALGADKTLLAQLFGDDRWDREIIIAPLGTMVHAGLKLLQGTAPFERFVRSCL
jgi:Fe-S-cluster containining protein